MKKLTEKELTEKKLVEKEKKLGRRSLLKLGGIGVASLATAKVAKVASAAEKSLAGKKFAMVIDLNKCYGCQACHVACKSEFSVPLGGFRSWVTFSQEEGKYPDTKRHFIPQMCNHCETPSCIKVCPVKPDKATYKRKSDGAVLVDEDKCIGCKLCTYACPYNMRFMNPEKKSTAAPGKYVVDKCTLCVHRIEKGVVPSCQNTCPAEARTFGDISDPNSKAAKLLAANKTSVLLPQAGTNPNVYYIVPKDVKALKPSKQNQGPQKKIGM